MSAAPLTLRRLRGELLLVSLCLLWGSSFVIIKDVQHAISAWTLVFLRFGVGAVLMAPLLRRGRALWLAGVELGVWMGVGFAMQAVGLRYTGAGRSAFVTSLNVIFVPMLASLAGRRVGLVIWLAAGVAFGGATLLCYDGATANRGDLWTLGAALVFAAYIWRLESFAARLPALPLTAAQMLVVTALALPWFAHDWVMAGPPAVPWVSVLYLAVVCTVVTTWLQTVGQRDVPAAQASILYMLEPVFASVFAYVRIGERMGWRGWVGAAVILAATLLSQLPLLRRRRPITARPGSPAPPAALHRV